MTDNEILARWQGWKVKVIKPDIIQYPIMFPDQWVMYNDEGEQQPLPDYPNDAAACDSLLDTLVEKGFIYRLRNSKYGHTIVINHHKMAFRTSAPTRSEAIVAACLEVARKEAQQ